MSSSELSGIAWQTANPEDSDAAVVMTFEPTPTGPEVVVIDDETGTTTTIGGTVSPQAPSLPPSTFPQEVNLEPEPVSEDVVLACTRISNQEMVDCVVLGGNDVSVFMTSCSNQLTLFGDSALSKTLAPSVN